MKIRTRTFCRLAVGALAIGVAALTLPAGAVRAADEATAEAEPSSQERRDTWYAQAVGRGERGALITHFWSDGPRFRAEMVIAGHRIVTIVSGEYYHIIDELTRKGISIRRAPHTIKGDTVRGRPFGRELEDMKEKGAEFIRKDRLAGRECEVYRLTNSAGRKTLWVNVELGLPIRVENFNRKSGTSDGLDYINWQSGFRVPSDFFEPEPGYEMERIELEDYRKRSRTEIVGPAPVVYSNLLWGRSP